VLVPLPGRWHSSPTSNNVIACPNPRACRARRDGQQKLLQACSESYYSALDTPGNNVPNASPPPCTMAGASPEATSATHALPTYQDLQCSPGYSGNLCGRCSHHPPSRYGQSSPFLCRKCSNRAWQVVLILLFVIAKAVVFGYIMHATVVSNIKQAGMQPHEWGIEGSDWLAIVVLFYQVISILLQVGSNSTGFDSIPGAFKLLLSVSSSIFSVLAVQLLAPLQCVLRSEGPAAVAHMLTRIALAVLDLCCSLGFAALFWRLAHRSSHMIASTDVELAAAVSRGEFDAAPASAAAGATTSGAGAAAAGKSSVVSGTLKHRTGSSAHGLDSGASPSHHPHTSHDVIANDQVVQHAHPAASMSGPQPGHPAQDPARNQVDDASTWVPTAAPTADHVISANTIKPSTAPVLGTTIHSLLWSTWLAATLFSYFVSNFPTVVNSMMSAFNCVSIDGKKYWALDPNTACYSGSHLTLVLPLLGIPLLLVCVAVLLGSCAALSRPASVLRERASVLKYGSMFKPFRCGLVRTNGSACDIVRVAV
jgi:hypothetical protein